MTTRELLTSLDMGADGIASVYSAVFGARYWFDADGACHREDGPAIVSDRGGAEWYKHGLLHRVAGPAITRSQPERVVRVEADPAVDPPAEDLG